MAGHTTLITTKSGAQLLYITSGLPMFNTLPKSTITGEPIKGDFINSAFKSPKIRAEVSFAEELITLAGEVSTETKVRAAFDKLKAKHRGTETKAPAPRKAKATTSVKRAPKGKQAAVPSMDQMDRAKFDAAMRIMQDLVGKFETKAA